jgi:hypothetical protein
MSGSIEAVMMELLEQAGSGKSISPEAVARALDAEDWRRRLSSVRTTAVGLARQGQITILRHNKPADPNTFKGVYRLSLPRPA